MLLNSPSLKIKGRAAGDSSALDSLANDLIRASLDKKPRLRRASPNKTRPLRASRLGAMQWPGHRERAAGAAP